MPAKRNTEEIKFNRRDRRAKKLECWNDGILIKSNSKIKNHCSSIIIPFFHYSIIDGLVKSHLKRHPGESRGPEQPEITGFRLSPE
jgi:hypothetical protein